MVGKKRATMKCLSLSYDLHKHVSHVYKNYQIIYLMKKDLQRFHTDSMNSYQIRWLLSSGKMVGGYNAVIPIAKHWILK